VSWYGSSPAVNPLAARVDSRDARKGLGSPLGGLSPKDRDARQPRLSMSDRTVRVQL
jgi:hypothetical protein